MTCDEIMKRDVLTTTEKDTLQRAAEIMAAAEVGFLPVCDDGGKVVGTITDRDITVRAVARGKSPGSSTVSEVMTREVVACRPHNDLAVAEQLMAQFHKSRILITGANGELQGVISLSDLAERELAGRAAVTLRHVAEREVRG